MLMFQSGRFYVGKSSFTLPDGSIINTIPDVQPEAGMVFFPSSKEYSVNLNYEYDEEENAESSLNHVLSDFRVPSKAMPVLFEKASGWESIYDCSDSSIYEVHVDVNQDSLLGENKNVLVVFVLAPLGSDMGRIRNSDYMQSLLNSIEQ